MFDLVEFEPVSELFDGAFCQNGDFMMVLVEKGSWWLTHPPESLPVNLVVGDWGCRGCYISF